MLILPKALPARCEEDDGFGLITVLGFSAIAGALLLVMFGMTQNALRQSGRHVAFEQSVHAAEQGIDQTLARVNQNRAWSCGPDAPAFTTPAAEEAWARSTLIAVETAGTCPKQQTAQGTFIAIRPANRNVVYAKGVSSAGSRDARERVLKTEYLFSTYNPTHAVLTGGDFTISGNPAVTGQFAAIHTNEDLSLTGGSASFTGTLTATGSAALNGYGAQGSGGNKPLVDIPAIRARYLWERFAAANADNWFDLCPDNTVRRPDGASPCTGSVLDDDGDFRGWTLSGDNWDKDNSIFDGVYYAYQRSIKVAGNPGETGGTWWQTSLLAESDGSTCSAGNGKHGSVEVSGNPRYRPYLPGVGIIADRDFVISGNPYLGDATGPMLMASREQFKISGNPVVLGAVIARDECHSADSPVPAGQDFISGNPSLTNNGGLNVDLSSLVRTTLWLEL